MIDKDVPGETGPDQRSVPEYQKVAALMALDIDILYNCAKHEPEQALEFFEMLRDMAALVQNNEEARDSRYSTMADLIQLGRAAGIKSEVLKNCEDDSLKGNS